MITFIILLVVLSTGWGLFLGKNRRNPGRAFIFVISSLVYFTAVFVAYYLLAGGPS